MWMYNRYVKKSQISLNAYQLKIIAYVSTLIDHIGYMIIYKGMMYGYNQSLYLECLKLPEGKRLYLSYSVCRFIGRIAFPIFCYLLVEGYYNTRNYFKYVSRMLFFALLTEIPFNLVVNNSFLYTGAQNVLWTFLLGLFSMGICGKLKNSQITNFFKILIFIISGYLAYILKTDYSYFGIALIFIFYYFRYDTSLMFVLFGLACILKCVNVNFLVDGIFPSVYFNWFYLPALLALPFIYLYNHKKGKSLPGHLGYLFYPIHFLILYLIVWVPYYLSTIK